VLICEIVAERTSPTAKQNSVIFRVSDIFKCIAEFVVILLSFVAMLDFGDDFIDLFQFREA
jgi:hypothetical protein